MKAPEPVSDATVCERGGEKPEKPSGAKLARGTNLGRYVLLDPIGKGGLGVVYAAYDPQLDRKVALKLLRPRANSSATASEGKARLLREAQAMARLSHPNVVAVHDVGVHEDQVFIAMDLVEGETLTTWKARQKRTPHEVLDIFLQAGRGLAAAHAANLVHRDFKPDNVLIDQNGRALVMDFGLARAADIGDQSEVPPSPEAPTQLGRDSAALAVPLTGVGIVMGTPGYAAPEQLRGDAADALSDQFSFCASLYEALYGELPFAGNTLGSYAAAIEQSGARPVMPAGRVPARLRRILLKGMSLTPGDRFKSLDDLLRELCKDTRRTLRWVLLPAGVLLVCSAAFLGLRQYRLRREGECEDSAGRLAGTWDPEVKAKIHRAFAATGKPFAQDAWNGVSGALDSYASIWTSMRDEACAETRLRNQQTEEVFFLRMVCFERERAGLKALIDVLTQADGSIVENAVVAVQSLEKPNACSNLAALRAEPNAIPTDPARAARFANFRGRLAEATALYDAGQYEKVIPLATALAADCDATAERWFQAEALFILGGSQRRSDNFTSSAQAFSQAYVSATSSRNEAVAARSASSLVEISTYLGKSEDAQLWSSLAQAVIAEIGGSDELEADLLLRQANASFLRGDYSDAVSDSARALDLAKRVFGPDDRRTVSILNTVAIATTVEGRWTEGMELSRQVATATEKALGPDHPLTSLFLANYGQSLGGLGRALEGNEVCKRSLTIATHSTGNDSDYTANALTCLARSARYLGELDQALASAKRIVAIYERRQPVDAQRPPNGLDEVGLAWLAKGRYAEALQALEKSVAMRERTHGPDHVELQDALDGAGRAYLGLHQPMKAIPLLERAVRLRQRGLAEPGQLGATLFALARARSEAKGSAKFARDLAVQARDELAKYPWWASTLQQVDAWLKSHPSP
jgi:eukaryotic-like serine/threonine-protein kinase